MAVSIYGLTATTEAIASGDLIAIVDISEATSDKTKKITYANFVAGLQPSSTILTALSSGLSGVDGLVYWNGSAAVEISEGDGIDINTSTGLISISLGAGSGISITGTTTKTIALNHLGLQNLSTPGSNSLILVESGGTSSFLTAGTGISFSGSAISLSHLGMQSLVDPNADRIMFWDDSAGALKWLSIASNAGIAINGTVIEHAAEPVAVSLRAVANGTVVTNDIVSYWTIPAELNGAVLQTVDAGFISASGGVTVQLARATASSPTTFSNVLSAAVISSNWSSLQSGGTQGTGSISVSKGDRIRVTTSSTSGSPEGLDIFMGFSV